MKFLLFVLVLSMGFVTGMWVQSNDYPITQVYEDGSFKGCMHDGLCNK